MNDDRLAGLLHELKATQDAPDSFESVLTSRRTRWRLRRAPVAVVAAGIVAVAVAMLQPKSEQSPRLASLAQPPTTDWLLETPRADWLTRDPTRIEKENSHDD